MNTPEHIEWTWWKRKEVEAYLRKSKSSVTRMIKSGLLNPKKLGGNRYGQNLFDPEEVKNLVKSIDK